jgi:hypothetical protein
MVVVVGGMTSQNHALGVSVYEPRNDLMYTNEPTKCTINFTD